MKFECLIDTWTDKQIDIYFPKMHLCWISFNYSTANSLKDPSCSTLCVMWQFSTHISVLSFLSMFLLPCTGKKWKNFMSSCPFIILLAPQLWTSSKVALVRRTARSNSGDTVWTVLAIISGKTFANFPPSLFGQTHWSVVPSKAVRCSFLLHEHRKWELHRSEKNSTLTSRWGEHLFHSFTTVSYLYN